MQREEQGWVLGQLKGESGRRLPAPKLIRERGRGRGRGRGRQSWVLRQRPWAGLAKLGSRRQKSQPVPPSPSAPFSTQPLAPGPGTARIKAPTPFLPPHGAFREPLNLPTIASSARYRSSSPRRSPNRDNFSTAAEAFGPTHPPPSSSSSPIRLLRVLLLGLDQDNTPNNNTLCLSRPCPASIASEPSSPSANPPQSPIQPSTTSTLARRLRSALSKAPHDASTKTHRRPCPIDAQPPFRLHQPA